MGRTIRHATQADTEQILDIYRGARVFMRQTGNPNQWPDTYPGLADIERDRAADSLYVMEEEGELLAVFYYGQGPDPTYDYIEGAWIDDGSYRVVHRIAARAGKGAGKECLAWARDHTRSMRIDTHADNGPMQHVLESLGFTRCGIIYLENGDPRVAFQHVNA